MDEKRFLLGRLDKVGRIFLKELKGSGKPLVVVQDGSRDSLIVLATLCADGAALAPLLISQSESGIIQDTWLKEFKSRRAKKRSQQLMLSSPGRTLVLCVGILQECLVSLSNCLFQLSNA